MKIIHKTRCSGKTTELLIRADTLCGNVLVVVHSESEAKRLEHEIHINGYDIPKPITYSVFLNNSNKFKDVDHFLIDNAEMLLSELAKGKLYAVSINKE